MTFKIATWNVNSLRVRLPHVLTWLEQEKPDVLALQETKTIDEDFPLAAINDAGYQVVYSGQRTYNGVAILSRNKADNILKDIPGLDDHQRRILGVTVGDIRILDLYVPNGESVVSPKYQYKLDWLKRFDAFLKEELLIHPKTIILGDFNIAPHDIDVHEPKFWEGKVLFSAPERQAFQDLLDVGFSDCYRHLNPNEKEFTWWDYRLNAFKRNLGLRIDHILASSALAPECQSCFISKEPRSWERPSDHAPVVAEFDLK